VRDQPGLRLDELIGQLCNSSTDDIFALIASNRIFVDLRAARLAEPERVRVFRDADIAHACELIGCKSRRAAISAPKRKAG
jgi:putative transposase